MTINDQAINEIANAILNAAKQIVRNARFDKTRIGVVTATGEKYTVRIDGTDYSVPSSGGSYSVGDTVLVLFIQNNANKTYIIGKG